MTGRRELSSTGGHQTYVSAHGGYGWSTGNATIMPSYTESDPVSNVKAGWTSRNHSARHGGDELYNFVNAPYCKRRSGGVQFSFWSDDYLTLPPGNDGRSAQPEDFREVVPEDCVHDIPSHAGGATKDYSIILDLHQGIGDDLSLNAEYLHTRAKTERKASTFGSGTLTVPASNAFNNFGREVFVGYDLVTEIELGLVPENEQTNESEQIRYVVGLGYEFTDQARLEIGYSKGQSLGRGSQFMFAPPSRSRDTPELRERLEALLASDDPDVALNVFGDGTGQNPAAVAEFYRPYAYDNDRSHIESLEGHFAFDGFELPAGRVGIVVGGESRRQWIEDVAFNLLEETLGLGTPTQEYSTVFGEFMVPVIADSDIAGLHDLALTVQVRRDRYSSEGAVGRIFSTSPSGERMAEPDIHEVTFDNTSTRFGIAWAPAPNMKVRLSRAEAFRAPLFSDLFSPARWSFPYRFTYDPLGPPFYVNAIRTTGSNPDLKPQLSVNTTVGLEWSPAVMEGLEVRVDYSEIDYENLIAHSYALARLLPLEVYGNLPQFYRREPDGTLIEAITTSINISRRLNRTVDLHVAYSLPTGWGTFRSELTYQRVLKMFDEALPGTGKVGFVGEFWGVDRYKASGRLHWRRDPFLADLHVRYTPGYVNNAYERIQLVGRLPNSDVEPHWTVDLTGSYEMASGLTLRAGGRNIFDADFPYALNGLGLPWDTKRVDLRKRVLFLEASYDIGFD